MAILSGEAWPLYKLLKYAWALPMLSTTKLGSCNAAASTVTYPLCRRPKSDALKAAYLSFSSIRVYLIEFGMKPNFPWMKDLRF